MDFYSRQATARRQSRWLVAGFLLAVLGVALAIDFVLFTLLGSGNDDGPRLGPFEFAARNPGAAFFCTLFVIAVIGISSLFKSLQLRSGGGVVALSLGGVRVDPDTLDPKRRRLRNVVEEMAIASGVPVPEIYVLEGEAGINAFAAGHTPANAAVTVTQGALDRLNREQLQGVIAHEFSHVVNGDMRLNVQLMGWIFGLFVVTLIGRTILRIAPRGGRKGGGAILIAALAFVILGYIGLLAGRILQAAVSRQRERLADASAVQFTRNPGGLKEALLKIAGFSEGSKLGAAGTEQVAHMLFAPGLNRMLATHPPLAERIHALDPSFNERMLPRLAADAAQGDIGIDEFNVAVRSSMAPAHEPLPTRPRVEADAEGIAAQVGQVDMLHIERARALRLSFPEGFNDFAVSPGAARSLVLALLLSREESLRNRQLTRLANGLEPAALAAVRKSQPIAEQLAPMLRLPAVLRVFPAIRRLPLTERQALCEMANDLIIADAQIDVFEFCLARMLETFLQDEMSARAPHGDLQLKDTVPELQLLFATLAGTGASSPEQARAAYDAGFGYLEIRAEYAKDSNWQRDLAPALTRLEKLQPLAKKNVIEGLVKTIAHDDILNVGEAELLRTVCAILHCPLPPLLPTVAT